MQADRAPVVPSLVTGTSMMTGAFLRNHPWRDVPRACQWFPDHDVRARASIYRSMP